MESIKQLTDKIRNSTELNQDEKLYILTIIDAYEKRKGDWKK